ncbi:hypothetical protein BJ878DRAFT_560929 [Calycina marina]|uniref:Uncharacterized protein n=1 Tax=Calycina marina TaxID=1763456 RepID=A0A9P7ZBT8_9HELO|nr:hypothetical protein BJ878DRAFT_560929 [Calycina marina]
MPIRNPFARRPDIHTPVDENTAPSQTRATPAFERVDTVGSRTSALSIKSGHDVPAEYKLSVVNDSGVYLPPSPPEKKGLWPRRSNISSHTRTSEDVEQFSISRESFDSYRRSFDISARSPVPSDNNGRQSLDSARLPRFPRSAIDSRRFDRQPATAEEGFEDVGLNDEKQQAKKRGFFSRIGDSSTNSENTTSQPAEKSSSGGGIAGRFHIGGRKRGQSVGEELGSISRPETSKGTEPTIKE